MGACETCLLTAWPSGQKLSGYSEIVFGACCLLFNRPGLVALLIVEYRPFIVF